MTYVLGGDDDGAFAIDSMTGQLKTSETLTPETLFDFEAMPAKTSYMVTVTVTDGKEDENNVETTDTITVTIMVMDVNDAPEFPSTITPISVAENTVPNANIGDPVVAMDEDSGDTLTYTLGGTADAASFDVVPLWMMRMVEGSCKPRQHWTMKPRATMR